jgi:hypothetical protein
MFKFLKRNGLRIYTNGVAGKSMVNLNLLRNVLYNDVYDTYLKTNVGIYKYNQKKFSNQYH